MKVLIVEDEVLVALYLQDLVASFGHQVCALAASAPEAVEHAGRHSPDVALMDMRLARGTSGIDAAREIYSRHGVRCIFLSGNLTMQRAKLWRRMPLSRLSASRCCLRCFAAPWKRPNSGTPDDVVGAGLVAAH